MNWSLPQTSTRDLIWSPKYISSLTFASKLFSNFSDELIATLSGLNETKEGSPLLFTFTFKAWISSPDSVVIIQFPPLTDFTFPFNWLFSPINCATKELSGFSYKTSGEEICWIFPSLNTAKRFLIDFS